MAAKEDQEYLLGQHGREVERLQKQHRWIQSCLKGKIVFAPVELDKSSLRVLDVGCADGTLLRDLQKQVSPSAQLVGSDVMGPFLPTSPQGNIRYVQADICEPPTGDLAGSFDLTHVRYVLPGCARVGLDTAVANLAATLAPGGWLQIQEMNVDPNRPDAGPAWQDVNSILSGMFAKIGMGSQFTLLIADSMKKAGLANVSVETIDLPMGKLIEGEQQRKDSIEPFKITIPVISQAAKEPNNVETGLGVELPESTYDRLPERFQDEAMNQGVVFRCLVIVGQKPV
ncbi:unnamed protein product [Clonostachys chloroleuca]|uniref:Methyltransferase domain-containing protein n=1 Tax=Clonostachys chloroleuca TaxID=1926264 RepID=A0AA35LVN7_9HYPO|nr:unnamed protein product [Clonostachys chloroleuca]